MDETFAFHRGTTPLLISVPHDGRSLPDEIRARMSPVGLDIPDTDWHVAKLYDFANDLGASILVAHCSRYVVDLNRSADDEVLYPGQAVTGLCPLQSFAGENLYRDGQAVGNEERRTRVQRYWQPYHDRLAQALDESRQAHGYALLWDAHSIPGEVPRLFDGALPALNIGTFDQKSCAAAIANPVVRLAGSSPYETVLNGRFKGGYITRHYGDPDNHIHAIQLEIAQRNYMDERSRLYDEQKAERLRALLASALGCFQDSAARHYGQDQ